LLPWFWTLFLISSDKPGHCALSLSKEMGVSYWVAWTMLQKIRTAMGQHDDKYRFKNIWRWMKPILAENVKAADTAEVQPRQRSWSPCPPPVEKRSAGFVKMRLVRALDAVTIRAFVRNYLEPGCTIQTDGLNIYAGLESLVKEHQSFMISRGAEPLIKTFLLGTYHGRPDPKHLQAYLNQYCYRVNRRFWENTLFPRLVAACANGEPISYSELTHKHIKK
jgi:hypothetical protein